MQNNIAAKDRLIASKPALSNSLLTLGPTFSNFYMGDLENSILNNAEIMPEIYTRYIDDIYCSCSLEKLKLLKSTFEEKSVLKFTYEAAVNNKLPFFRYFSRYK